MVSKRLINEEGHQRKFLCVVDGSSECSRAVLYAERRARWKNTLNIVVTTAIPTQSLSIAKAKPSKSYNR